MWLKSCLNLSLLLLLSQISENSGLSPPPHRHSGIYIDNGEDQTIIHKLTTKKEKLLLEHEILKLLGFPDKPKTGSNGKAPLMKRSAPKFLLNIYRNSSGQDLDQKLNQVSESSDFNLSRNELQTIDESDVIITFTAQQSHQGAGGKPDRVKRIWFDVSGVPDDEEMTSAELRLYRSDMAKNQKNRGGFTITAYRVIRTKDGERGMVHVDSVDSSAGQRGWIKLNLTESLKHWMENPEDNRGIYLSVKAIEGSDHETRPEDIGIVGFKGDLELQPFMAGFFKSSGLKQGRVGGLSLGGFKTEAKRSRRSDAEDVGDLLKGLKMVKGDQNEARTCKLQTLYVSFKDLQWQDWIIAPEGYDAFFCRGECKFPLHTRMNATNHAIIQTLVHLLQPNTVPKPCCTPTQLSSISVLYFLDENNVVLKKYRNMVVRGCGCH